MKEINREKERNKEGREAGWGGSSYPEANKSSKRYTAMESLSLTIWLDSPSFLYWVYIFYNKKFKN